MLAPTWSLDRLLDELELLGSRGLPREQYFAELGPRLRRVIDSDACCWHTLDPETLLITSDAPTELIESGVLSPQTAAEAGSLLIRSEYFLKDFNSFADLARRRVPVGILDQSTRGRPERSTRYRDLLEPFGIPFELRAAFVARGRAWGAVHIARQESKGPFSRRDAGSLAALAGVISHGIRTSLRFDAARRPDRPGAPGLVVLNAGNDVELITPPAVELFSALRSPAPHWDERTPPSVVLSLAGFARDHRSRGGATDVVTAPSSLGWITLHASLPDAPGTDRVAIVLERATGASAAALRLEVEGVTAREREIAVHLAQGLSQADIAQALVLSPHTVQDHVKSLYEKLGVSSRQELVARVFLDEYAPALVAGTALTAAGQLAPSR